MIKITTKSLRLEDATFDEFRMLVVASLQQHSGDYKRLERLKRLTMRSWWSAYGCAKKVKLRCQKASGSRAPFQSPPKESPVPVKSQLHGTKSARYAESTDILLPGSLFLGLCECLYTAVGVQTLQLVLSVLVWALLSIARSKSLVEQLLTVRLNCRISWGLLALTLDQISSIKLTVEQFSRCWHLFCLAD